MFAYISQKLRYVFFRPGHQHGAQSEKSVEMEYGELCPPPQPGSGLHALHDYDFILDLAQHLQDAVHGKIEFVVIDAVNKVELLL